MSNAATLRIAEPHDAVANRPAYDGRRRSLAVVSAAGCTARSLQSWLRKGAGTGSSLRIGMLAVIPYMICGSGISRSADILHSHPKIYQATTSGEVAARLSQSEVAVVEAVLDATAKNRRATLRFSKLGGKLLIYDKDSIDQDSAQVIGSGNLYFDLSGGRSPGGVALFAGPSDYWNPIDCVAINAYKKNHVMPYWGSTELPAYCRRRT